MSSSKSLPPSQRKLRKAREDGDVAKSRDLSTFLVLTSCYLYIFYAWSPISKIADFFSRLWSSLGDFHSNNMIVYAVEAGLVLFELLAPFLVLLFASAFVAEAFQVGFHFSLKSLLPDVKKLGFFKGLRRILGIPEEGQSGNMAFGLLYEIGKMALLLFFVIGILLVCFYELVPRFALVEPQTSGDLMYRLHLLFRPVASCGIFVCGLLGLLDYLIQRKRRFERLKMDVSEFRKEMRESEGDPELKGMRKQLFQESIFGSSLNAIRKAKVLVLGRKKVK